MDAGFLFSLAVVAALAIGLLVASHIGARQVAAHKVRRVIVEAAEAEGEPPLPFDEPTPPERELFERERV
jgi:hypothetical protein